MVICNASQMTTLLDVFSARRRAVKAAQVTAPVDPKT